LLISAATGLLVNLLSGGGTINSGTNSIVIGSVLGSTGGLTKVGTGTLTLTNVNTYSGGTIVNAGILLANSSGGTGTGAVNINIGGTLGGTGTIAGLVTNNAGGILMPGVAGSGTLSVTNSLKLLSGSTNTFVVNGTTSLASNSVALGAGAMTYGGVLNILTNGTFTVGQTFQVRRMPATLRASPAALVPGSYLASRTAC
jgi:fibronectin-binding autotransporter adhesin